jgi:predicted nucleic acid-binding protein
LILLDASAAVELVLETDRGTDVARRLVGESVQIPTHCDLETASALRRAVLRNTLSARDGWMALDTYRHASFTRWEIRPLLSRAWELSQHVTIADGLYVALAEALGAPLLTCDERVARAHGHDAVIELAT